MSWEYIAGYFDGEGHVSLCMTGRGIRARSLMWANTNRESLEAMRSFMGVGRVVARKKSRPHYKQPYELKIGKKSELLHVLNGMECHLIIKRAQAAALRAFLETVDDSMMVNFGKAAAVSTDQLVQWHHIEKKSHDQIAALIGVTRTSISRELRKRGISQPVRVNGGGVHTDAVKQRLSALKKAQWADPEWAKARREAMRAGIQRRASETN